MSTMLERSDNGGRQDNGLRLHQWMSLKSQSEIEHFRLENGLIRVDAKPQDAALTPSWPQLLARTGLYSCMVIVLLLLVWNGSMKSERKSSKNATAIDLESAGSKNANPLSDPIVRREPKEGIQKLSEPYTNLATNRTHHLSLDDNRMSKSRYASLDLNVVLVLPVLFLVPFWLAAFIISEMEGKHGGWVSVLYWAEWIPLTTVSWIFWIPLLLHWSASLAMLIQRWTGSIGSIAYEITDLHGCIPYDGLDYLQEGRYSQGFRIFQTVGFVALTLWSAYIARKILKGRTFSIWSNNPMGIVLLALVVYIGVIADRGMPIVVSGNCLLVEESAGVGFVKADIRTAWKVLSFFIPVY